MSNPAESLGEFLALLEDAGQLRRVKAPVDAALELTEICRRFDSSAGGPALLFENVRGSHLPVVANLFGHPDRLTQVVGLPAGSETTAPPSLGSRFRAWVGTGTPRGDAPRLVRTAPGQQVVRIGKDVSLAEWPFPRFWPQDSHPLITAGLLVSADPMTGRHSAERIPLQILDRSTLAPLWEPGQSAARHFRSAAERRVQLPVCVVLGGPPALTLLPYLSDGAAGDAWETLASLKGGAVDVAKSRTNELTVPAQAELVIEGYLDTLAPTQRVAPASREFGFYGTEAERPVIQVTALTHRATPILPVSVPGPPPAEEYWLQQARQRALTPLLQQLVPDVLDVHMPPAGNGQRFLFVRLRKSGPFQVRQTLHLLWGLPFWSQAKFTVVVDESIDVRDEQAVWFQVAAHVAPGRDTIFAEGPADPLDHSSDFRGFGGKIGLDATAKEGPSGDPWPRPLTMPAEIIAQVGRRSAELGLHY